MFTISKKSRTSAVHTRYPNAREASAAYRRMEDEGEQNLSVTDNRVHEPIEIGELERYARAEASGAPTPERA